MSCDCLTKSMPEDYLVKILDTNLWDVSQSTEAKATKLRKAAGVQRRKAEKADTPSHDAPTSSGHMSHDAPTSSGHMQHDASKFSEHMFPDDGHDSCITADAG